MKDAEESGKMVTVEGGWAICPVCRYKHLKRVHENETAALVFIHCRHCKNEIPLTLKQGQCFQSQSQLIGR